MSSQTATQQPLIPTVLSNVAAVSAKPLVVLPCFAWHQRCRQGVNAKRGARCMPHRSLTPHWHHCAAALPCLALPCCALQSTKPCWSGPGPQHRRKLQLVAWMPLQWSRWCRRGLSSRHPTSCCRSVDVLLQPSPSPAPLERDAAIFGLSRGRRYGKEQPPSH